jgi:phosphocarrier protein HPr
MGAAEVPMVERSFIVINRLGIHARAASRFVQLASRFAADVEVEKDRQRVNGKAVLAMLTLVVSQGTAITVRCLGDDAPEAMNALGELIESGFGEGPAMPRIGGAMVYAGVI